MSNYYRGRGGRGGGGFGDVRGNHIVPSIRPSVGYVPFSLPGATGELLQMYNYQAGRYGFEQVGPAATPVVVTHGSCRRTASRRPSSPCSHLLPLSSRDGQRSCSKCITTRPHNMGLRRSPRPSPRLSSPHPLPLSRCTTTRLEQLLQIYNYQAQVYGFPSVTAAMPAPAAPPVPALAASSAPVPTLPPGFLLPAAAGPTITAPAPGPPAPSGEGGSEKEIS
ncbi:hypothetical protein BKA59DRAFT_518797 [Fusarium tricinctum]|uniref:Uncharacterized protein n=1 Tax=Fusarium tricinctum TaxID=61284 RepID=A0A8K0WHY3_9HYPO|nr:hypothetical protein BKA59DRAFT_518797 [Fusarium tricinctum]